MSAPTEAEATAMGFTEQSENFWVKPPGRYQTKKHEKYLCKHCGKESDYRTEEKGRHLASCVLTKPIYFSDIPPFPSHRYEVNISWDYLEQHLHDEMNPGDGMAALNQTFNERTSGQKRSNGNTWSTYCVAERSVGA